MVFHSFELSHTFLRWEYRLPNIGLLDMKKQMLRDCFQAVDEAGEGQDGFLLRAAVAQDSGALQRLLASHDKEVGAIAPLGEMYLLGQGLDADVLC